jgi:ATP-binding protein involved in chromosome partitioning
MSLEILQALSKVIDPDLKKDIVSLNMVRNLVVSDNEVSFDLILTTPACPMKDYLLEECNKALSDLENCVGKSIKITVGAEVFGQSDPLVPGIKNIIAVSSGKGGVGKSTIALGVAKALHNSGASVGLLDADIYGPSIPRLTQLQNQRPEMIDKEGKSMIVPMEAFGLKVMSIGLLIDPNQPMVWRGPMASSAIRQLFTDVDWGELDYLVIDLPPGTGDIHLTIAKLLKINGALIVTTPSTLSLDDAIKGARMFMNPQVNVPILGVVENMSWFSPAHRLEEKYFLFGKDGGKQLSLQLQIPLLAQIPLISNEGQQFTDEFIFEPIELIMNNLASEIAREIVIRQTNKN